MPVRVRFHCDNCDAVADGTRHLRAPFVSVSGRSYGFGSRREQLASTVAPAGWVAYDPYIACCYCPSCAVKIGLTSTAALRGTTEEGR